MGYWNYRVVRELYKVPFKVEDTDPDQEEIFSVKSIYYTDGKPDGAGSVNLSAPNLGDLKWDFNAIQLAFSRPILFWDGDKFIEEPNDSLPIKDSRKRS